jgi:hypothetical protein
MLTFSSTQLAQFEDRVVARFVARTTAAFRAAGVPGSAGLSEAELGRRVALGVARGRGYGLRFDVHLGAFARLMLRYGPDFDEHPVVRGILTDRHLPDPSRMDALLAAMSQQNWDELALMADEALWREPAAGGVA